MKLGKLSLVAVMALGASAYALDNVKVDGEAKLWYQTSQYGGAAAGSGAGSAAEQKFFNHDTNSSALAAVKVGVSGGLTENVTFNTKLVGVSTLGLENNVVGATPALSKNSDGTAAAGALNDQGYLEVANIKYATKAYDVSAGRMALNTPLCFTENWNVVDNTFEAAVAHAYVGDTILAAAYVGKHNGVGLLNASRGTTVANGGTFGNFAVNGAYAAAAINKSLPDTVLQAWYYNVSDVANAYWLQADTKIMGISLGVQASGMSPDSTSAALTSAAANHISTTATAAKASFDVAGVNLYGAYSQVTAGSIGFANVATGDKTALYTGLGSVYMDGEIVAAPDTKAWKVGASTKMVPGIALSTSYCEAKRGNNNGNDYVGLITANGQRNTNFTAFDVIAVTKVGLVDLTAIYTQLKKDDLVTNTNDKTTDTIRLIASVKF